MSYNGGNADSSGLPVGGPIVMNDTVLNGHAGESLPVEELIGQVLVQLRAMRSMKANWDGYNADPPSAEVLDYAAPFLDTFLRTATRANNGRADFPLTVAPARDGGLFVQIELSPIDLDFNICPDLSVEYLRTNSTTGEHEEGKLDPRPEKAISELAAVLIGFLQPA
jgi:hypothetical protein